MTITVIEHHNRSHERAGSPIRVGHRLRRWMTSTCACAEYVARRGLPIEGSPYNRVASSCVPYECGFILTVVAMAIHTCSAVTSSATRWTEPPP